MTDKSCGNLLTEYGVRYADHIVHDRDWRCVADVIASYHGSGYVDPRGQVTGTLVFRTVGTSEWQADDLS